jgi:4-hydroxy-tetrahydrodipicolinate reductase
MGNCTRPAKDHNAKLHPMKIAIIGYGKMGHEIETVLTDRGHEITLRATTGNPFSVADLQGTDVAIEFSRPESAIDNIMTCFDANCPVVVGTTGWYNRMPEVRTVCGQRNQAFFYATNFSIGVNVVFHLNKILAGIMNGLPEYEPGILEIHHVAKRDQPSGTAITLAEGILESLPHKTKWVNELASATDELTIISQREGDVPGTHVINYTSPVDNISLVHQATNRRGFALGAVKAAEWLKDRKGIFTMKDMLRFN